MMSDTTTTTTLKDYYYHVRLASEDCRRPSCSWQFTGNTWAHIGEHDRETTPPLPTDGRNAHPAHLPTLIKLLPQS